MLRLLGGGEAAAFLQARCQGGAVPVDELAGAVLVLGRIGSGLIGRRIDAELVLLHQPAVLVVGGVPHFGERLQVVVDPLHRSEEHTSELQSLMRISYAVFCLKKKKISTRSKSA